MRCRTAIMTIFVFNLFVPNATWADIPLSDATLECIDCHAGVHPGIVQDWHKSRHAKVTPMAAMQTKGLARKLSSSSIPQNLQGVAVGCAECHMLRPESHQDTFEHNGFDIHMVVSPDDCRVCHVVEAAQYAQNIMAHAYNNLAGNKLYLLQQKSVIGRSRIENNRIHFEAADKMTRAEACYYCHGTKLSLSGSEIRDTEAAGELEFPVIEGWPNQGVGRLNLDGSSGSCSACHTRHAFSIAMARKPYTCKECHIGPDVPAFKVYSASKHGNIFQAMHASWDFQAVPWTVGQDFSAPTCAVCHMSLITNPSGELVVKRTHQMNDRLPWRILGLIYAHPHPKEPNTDIILNKAGLQLPTDFDGGRAHNYLIDQNEMQQRRNRMQAVCLNCHGSTWVKGQWERFENTIHATNTQVRLATDIMREIWRLDLARGLSHSQSPFDEAIEKKWSDAWLFYANTIRFASAMGAGGDYAVFAGGRYQLSQTILELNDWLQRGKNSCP